MHMPQAVAAADSSPLLQDVVAFALEEARRQGASQYEIDASLSQGLGTTVRLGEVDTIEYQRDRGLAVTVYFGKRKGSASTADLGREAVRSTIEKACAIARYTAEDPYAGLVEPEYLARDIPDLDLDHPWGLAAEDAIAIARRCEQAGRAVDPRIANSEGASVSSQRHTGVYGNSLGFLAGFSGTSHSVSCSLIAQEGEQMQRDYWFSTARDGDRILGSESPRMIEIEIGDVTRQILRLHQAGIGVLGRIARDGAGLLHSRTDRLPSEVGSAGRALALAEIDRHGEAPVALVLDRIHFSQADGRAQSLAQAGIDLVL